MAQESDSTRLVLKDAVAVLRGLARELDLHERTLRPGDPAVEQRHEATAEALREVADVAHRVNLHLRGLSSADRDAKPEPAGVSRYDRRASDRRAASETAKGGRRRAPRRRAKERRATMASR